MDATVGALLNVERLAWHTSFSLLQMLLKLKQNKQKASFPNVRPWQIPSENSIALGQSEAALLVVGGHNP